MINIVYNGIEIGILTQFAINIVYNGIEVGILNQFCNKYSLQRYKSWDPYQILICILIVQMYLNRTG